MLPIFCSSPRISHFYKKPWFMSTEQCLETPSGLIAAYMSLLLTLSGPS